MKILYLHQHFTTPRGAGGIRSYQMARALIAQGHSVTMVCGSGTQGATGLITPFRRGARRGMVDGIDVVEIDLAYSNRMSFPRRALIFSRFMLRSSWIAMTEPCDVLFATTTPLTVGVPGILARWLRRKPFVFEVRDLWPELPRAMGAIRNRFVLALLSALEWASYRSADRLIGLSPGIVAGIASRGVASHRVRIVPNGCDVDLFDPEGPRADVPGIADDDLVALFAGTHGMANGLTSVLDAAACLKRNGRSDIKLVLVGDGMTKAALVRRAEAERLDNVVFLPPRPKAEVAALMRRANIGLQTLANVPAFYFGTSPNKFFDYLAAGRPVLNNYPGWLAELIKTHRCGFVTPPDDPAAFAAALCAAADDRAALQAMGKRALALANDNFNRADLALDWIDWVTGVVRRA